MSDRYKIAETFIPHFITCTIVYWIDALSKTEYKEILVKSLAHCIAYKGLQIHAWVIMSNHMHLIASTAAEKSLPEVIRDFKKFTSRELYSTIKTNPEESRREWILRSFEFAGKDHPDNIYTKVWQDDYHPICLDKTGILEQRMAYLHQNPVRAGLVWEPQHYQYSSAIDYYEGRQGKLSLVML